MRKLAPLIGALVWLAAGTLGVLLLIALPLARLVWLAGALGLTQLAVFYIVEGVVDFVRSLSPLRGTTWFKAKDATIPDITLRAMGLEIAVSLVAASLLIATSTLWQPLVHVDVPAWVIAFIALRVAGTHALIVLSKLRRPLAMVAMLFDLAAVLPLVALAEGTLGGTVVVATFITWIFVLLTAWMPAMQKLPKEKDPDPVDEADRWKLGNWLSTLEAYARRPLLAAVAGLALVVPSIAAILLNGLLFAPFLAIVRTNPSKEPGLRAMRGIITAAASILFVYNIGPTIFQAVFPASFGNGEALHTLAFAGVAILPLALFTDPVRASELRVGLGSMLALGLLIALAAGHGLDGVFWAIASSALITSTVGTTNRSPTDPIVSI